jgi:hypothetical protein
MDWNLYMFLKCNQIMYFLRAVPPPLWHICQRIAKSNNYVHVCLSVIHPSVWINSAPTGQIFVKFYTQIFNNMSDHFQVLWKLDKTVGTLCKNLCLFMSLIFIIETVFSVRYEPRQKKQMTTWKKQLRQAVFSVSYELELKELLLI